MPRATAKEKQERQQCPQCHGDPFLRTIHLLDKFRSGDNRKKRQHLEQEFPKKEDFIHSEMRWQDFIISHYADKLGTQVEPDGTNSPLWLIWGRTKANISKVIVAGGNVKWHVAPLPRIDRKPPEVVDIEVEWVTDDAERKMIDDEEIIARRSAQKQELAKQQKLLN